MPTLGVAVAILDDNRILLIKREDFEVWALPGGAVDAGESLAQAAVREARLVGVYSRPHWDHGGDHVVLFAGIPSGGVLLQDSGGEVLDARYFARHELPEALVPWHHQRIDDALDGVGGGVAWTQTTIWPFAQGMTPHELYDLRDRSGLSRQQFYARYLAPTMTEEHLDVGDG